MQSTNSWTTIENVEAVAHDMRRTLSLRLRTCGFC